jgi:hypothetical protein
MMRSSTNGNWFSAFWGGSGRGGSVIPKRAFRISFSSRKEWFSASNTRHFSSNLLTFKTAALLLLLEELHRDKVGYKSGKNHPAA